MALKKFNPTTPSQRNLVLVDTSLDEGFGISFGFPVDCVARSVSSIHRAGDGFQNFYLQGFLLEMGTRPSGA